MKQKIIKIVILLLLSQQAIGHIKIDTVKVDTLILVKHSRIAYCNSKVEEAFVLNERVLIQGEKVINLENRLENKEAEIDSFRNSLQFTNDQLHIAHTETSTVRQENQEVKDENKQLRKTNIVQKIGLVALTVLCIIVAAK